MGSPGGGCSSLSLPSYQSQQQQQQQQQHQQQHQQHHQQQPIMNSANHSNGFVTIEDQIRTVDKVIKECEHSRKSLEKICRRLDDLNDEVKRYRDFLGHEKSRRDPALYKTSNMDRPSVYNESICGTMGNLTAQLTQEWTEKLQSIHNAVATPQSSTPTSRTSDRC